MEATAAKVLAYVGNQPEVLEHLAPGFAEMDYSNFFKEPRNLFYGDERGVLLFFWRGEAIYELHYLLTDRLRGKEALRFIKKCLADVFTSHHAYAICGATPRENRAARAMNRALGGRTVGVSQDSFGRHCIVYALERPKWATL